MMGKEFNKITIRLLVYLKACDLRESLAYEYLADCVIFTDKVQRSIMKSTQFYLKVNPRGAIEYQLIYLCTLFKHWF